MPTLPQQPKNKTGYKEVEGDLSSSKYGHFRLLKHMRKSRQDWRPNCTWFIWVDICVWKCDPLHLILPPPPRPHLTKRHCWGSKRQKSFPAWAYPYCGVTERISNHSYESNHFFLIIHPSTQHFSLSLFVAVSQIAKRMGNACPSSQTGQ